MNPQLRYPQPDLICLSHLRWNFVFQRPQHLMSRFATERRGFFLEGPIYDSTEPHLDKAICPRSQVCVVVPHLSTEADRNQELERLLGEFAKAEDLQSPIV